MYAEPTFINDRFEHKNIDFVAVSNPTHEVSSVQARVESEFFYHKIPIEKTASSNDISLTEARLGIRTSKEAKTTQKHKY